jgi:hypothetical protein
MSYWKLIIVYQSLISIFVIYNTSYLKSILCDCDMAIPVILWLVILTVTVYIFFYSFNFSMSWNLIYFCKQSWIVFLLSLFREVWKPQSFYWSVDSKPSILSFGLCSSHSSFILSFLLTWLYFCCLINQTFPLFHFFLCFKVSVIHSFTFFKANTALNQRCCTCWTTRQC